MCCFKYTELYSAPSPPKISFSVLPRSQCIPDSQDLSYCISKASHKKTTRLANILET